MGILLLTVKQERCSDLLLWSAAWLLLPLRLMPMPMPTMATAMALATLVLATLVLATPVLDMLVSAMPVLDTTVLLTARGRLRPSLRLMPSTDTELTPTPDTVMLVLATLPPTATATVWEPTELSELTTVKLVQLSSRSSTQSLLSVLLS